MITLIISNDEIHDIIKIAKSLEESGLLLKWVTETVQNEEKEQKGGFLSALLGTLGANLLGDLLISKGAIATSQGRGIWSRKRFNSVYSRHNLPKIKDDTYVINLDE